MYLTLYLYSHAMSVYGVHVVEGCMYTHLHRRMHVYMYAPALTHTCTCRYIYTHTYTHLHVVHTYTLMLGEVNNYFEKNYCGFGGHHIWQPGTR